MRREIRCKHRFTLFSLICEIYFAIYFTRAPAPAAPAARPPPPSGPPSAASSPAPAGACTSPAATPPAICSTASSTKSSACSPPPDPEHQSTPAQSAPGSDRPRWASTPTGALAASSCAHLGGSSFAPWCQRIPLASDGLMRHGGSVSNALRSSSRYASCGERRISILDKLSKEWFELRDHRKRLFSKAVWVPIYGTISPIIESQYPEIGFVEEVFVVGAAVIYGDKCQKAEELDWHHWSQNNSMRYIDECGRYHEAAAFVGFSDEELGFRLVLNQYVNSLHRRTVAIHPDIIFAYGLVEERDRWLKPLDGYQEVIRVRRHENEEIHFVEIRLEYLRDYLAARNSALRLYYYRQRQAIFREDPSFDWPKDNLVHDTRHNRCEVRSYKIDELGDAPGAAWAIFRTWRTDVDPERMYPTSRPVTVSQLQAARNKTSAEGVTFATAYLGNSGGASGLNRPKR